MLISPKIDWFDLLAVQQTLRNLLQHHSLKASILCCSVLYGPALTSVDDHWEGHSPVYTGICWQSNVSAFNTQSRFDTFFLVAETIKWLPAMWETWAQSLDWEDPLEKEMETHPSTLAWKISWAEEPCKLQSMGSQRVGHYWATSLFFFLPRSNCLLISWLQSPSTKILGPKKRISVTASTFSPCMCHEVMEPDAMILVYFLILNFKLTLSLSSSPSSRGSLVPQFLFTFCH